MAVEEWMADLQASGLGPSGVRQARQVLNSMLTLAVDAGYLEANPVDGVCNPRQPQPSMLFLDADQVERLAVSIRESYGTLGYILAYGGLRCPQMWKRSSDNSRTSGLEVSRPSRGPETGHAASNSAGDD